MPWRIVKQDEMFCVVKESDGKTVKCHPTREEAKSHLAALYVNEPSTSKKSLDTGFGLLKSLITERAIELKACGANKPGGGGFSAGNTCARGGGEGSSHKLTAPSPDAFLKDGNPGRGGSTPLPKGWTRSSVDSASKTVATPAGDYKVTVSYFNGYYASVSARSAGTMGKDKFGGNINSPTFSKDKVSWDKLQTELDDLSGNLASLPKYSRKK